METILYGDCHHLECCDIESDLCLKRYFTLFDINNFRHVRYGFCNDFIRLKLIEQRVKEEEENKYNTRYYRSMLQFQNFLEYYLINVMSKELDLRLSKWGCGNYGRVFNESPTVNFAVCERPRIYAHYSLQEATDIILDLLNKDGYLSRYSGFLDSYLYTIENELSKLLQYKKYKAQHAKCEAIMKRLNRNGIVKWYGGENDLMELISEIFKLKINKHESSK